VSFIYALSHNNEVRYVGVTKDIAKRLRDHLQPSNLKRHTHKNHWLQELLARGEAPIISVLEEVHVSKAAEAEQRWIRVKREAGCRLTNGTLGGEGCQGPSPATRAKIGAAHRGKRLSPETRAKIGAAHRGQRASAETKAKMSALRVGQPRPCGVFEKVVATRKSKFVQRCLELAPEVSILYENGYSIRKIAQKVGAAKTTIHVILEGLGKQFTHGRALPSLNRYSQALDEVRSAVVRVST
jgi:predicted GIY-YIG superfamily endonuclease